MQCNALMYVCIEIAFNSNVQQETMHSARRRAVLISAALPMLIAKFAEALHLNM